MHPPANEAPARDGAKRLIQSIFEQHGNVAEEKWERLGSLDPELRKVFELSHSRKDENAASYMST